MEWFRMYHGLLSDPKIMRMPVASRWHYIEMLCVASANAVRGELPPLADVAFLLRTTTKRAHEIQVALMKAGLIELNPNGKGLRVHGWESRQRQSDTSNERVKRYREKHSVTSNNRDCNVTETSRNRDLARRALDTDTEREENTPLKPPQGGTRRSPFSLPDWMPAKDWDDFLEMRRRQRKNPTDRAKELLVEKLDRLRAEGHEPARVIQRSIERGWQGLFALESEAPLVRPSVNGFRKRDPGAPKDTTGRVAVAERLEPAPNATPEQIKMCEEYNAKMAAKREAKRP